MNQRRRFIARAAAGGTLALPAWLRAAVDLGPVELPQGFLDTGTLDSLPGKRPLIRKSYRPPNFETPLALLNEQYTPNDAFFVRYHLSQIPWVNKSEWRLDVSGDAISTPIQLTFDQLRTFEVVELSALCMCSGNRRGLFQPHVPGVQWGHGAMGNARWKGARLRDILARAGVSAGAVEVMFDGADGPVLPKTPDYQKSIPIWKALDEHVLLAWEMNGEPLPHFNGFPVRVVVPGWTATYWMKHVSAIRVVSKPFESFWMKPAYRIPNGKFAITESFASQNTEANTPITEMVVNSLVTSHGQQTAVTAGREVAVRGVAWDGGSGIARVDYSNDSGASWKSAALGRDDGRFSWRQWGISFRPATPGTYSLWVRATNRRGQTQPFEVVPNPAGYHNNIVQKIQLIAS